jgi:hypothetical protein
MAAESVRRLIILLRSMPYNTSIGSWVLSGCDTELGVGDCVKLSWMSQWVCLREYKEKKNCSDVRKAIQVPPTVIL